MEKYRIRARRYSENDWVPEYTETSSINGVVVNNPKSPSGKHFKTNKEADEETLKILKQQGISESDIQIV